MVALRIEEVMSRLEGLPARDVESVRGMLRGGEPGLGLEVLCTQIYEWEIRLSLDTVESLEQLRADLEVEPRYTDLLRAELIGPDAPPES